MRARKQIMKDHREECLSIENTSRAPPNKTKRKKTVKFSLNKFKDISRSVFQDVRHFSQKLNQITKSRPKAISKEGSSSRSLLVHNRQKIENLCLELLQLLNSPAIEQLQNIKLTECIVKDTLTQYLLNKRTKRSRTKRHKPNPSDISALYPYCKQEQLQLLSTLSLLDIHPYFEQLEGSIRKDEKIGNRIRICCQSFQVYGAHQEGVAFKEDNEEHSGNGELLVPLKLENDSIFVDQQLQNWRDI